MSSQAVPEFEGEAEEEGWTPLSEAQEVQEVQEVEGYNFERAGCVFASESEKHLAANKASPRRIGGRFHFAAETGADAERYPASGASAGPDST